MPDGQPGVHRADCDDGAGGKDPGSAVLHLGRGHHRAGSWPSASVRAADRGVRVRILVDDLHLQGRDAVVAALDAHPNIEIRLFNPFAHRSAHLLDFIADFDRVNHRMHNKLFVMDNAVAIVGGRNIGNHYFEVHQQVNFRDLDVLAGGPVVREASRVFDHFWNSDLGGADPRRWWIGPPPRPICGRWCKPGANRSPKQPYPYPLDQDVADLKSELTAIFDDLMWAPGHMIFDDPDEIKRHGRTTTMTEGFYRRIGRLDSELLIEVPYLVVRERGLEAVKRLHDRGVRIRVLTNSLASNDVLAAHAGHAEHRKELIAAGVELYELRSDPAVKKRTFYLTGSPPIRHCTTRSWCSTARTYSSAASISILARETSTPRRGSTSRARSWPPR